MTGYWFALMEWDVEHGHVGPFNFLDHSDLAVAIEDEYNYFDPLDSIEQRTYWPTI